MTRKQSYAADTSIQRTTVERQGRRWSTSAQQNTLRYTSLEEAPVHVLLAEDDDDMRRMVTTALRTEGFDVSAVGSGSELLENIGERLLFGNEGTPVDLIVSDVRMPGRNGLHVLESLRQTDWMTPVILITAFGDPELHAEAHRLGAAAVLDKPLDLRRLRSLSRCWIGLETPSS